LLPSYYRANLKSVITFYYKREPGVCSKIKSTPHDKSAALGKNLTLFSEKSLTLEERDESPFLEMIVDIQNIC
jgi:hypothetical protein